MMKFEVGNVVTINWGAVEADGAVTEEMQLMRSTEAPGQTYTISRVDNTEAYPYVLSGYEKVTSFDEEELSMAEFTSEALF